MIRTAVVIWRLGLVPGGQGTSSYYRGGNSWNESGLWSRAAGLEVPVHERGVLSGGLEVPAHARGCPAAEVPARWVASDSMFFMLSGGQRGCSSTAAMGPARRRPSSVRWCLPLCSFSVADHFSDFDTCRCVGGSCGYVCLLYQCCV
jgi:hypothetical protein